MIIKSPSRENIELVETNSDKIAIPVFTGD